jgi:UDP-N-acetylglucosamine 2-epimerase
MKFKVITILGTRPEIIRLSEIIAACDEFFEHTLVFTGQNPQKFLSKVFFEDLNVRSPDILLDINGKNLGETFANLFNESYRIFESIRPDALLILGDTNSAFSSIIAKRMNIPIYHLEAGLRSFDENVPEEVNRRIIDRTSDFNLVYTEFARTNLLREGFHPRTISLMGSPMYEVITKNSNKIDASPILASLNLEKDKFYLASIHRQENVDDKIRLQKVMNKFTQLHEAKKLPIILSTHPRTLAKIEQHQIKVPDGVQIVEPFGFFDFCKLQKNAKLVISDSGTISEEASILNFRAITLRDSMERAEALESGSIGICGIDSDRFVEAVDFFEKVPASRIMPENYFYEDTSQRVIKFLQSTIGLHRSWLGLR